MSKLQVNDGGTTNVTFPVGESVQRHDNTILFFFIDGVKDERGRKQSQRLPAVQNEAHGNQAVPPPVADNATPEKNIRQQTGAEELDGKGNDTFPTERDFASHGTGSASLTNIIDRQKSQKRVAPATEDDTDDFDDSVKEERTIDPPSTKRKPELSTTSLSFNVQLIRFCFYNNLIQ
ncbi:hypothetical protein GCK72_015497 [Caenorhabditis remanei]|uniref:Uncharacterized protein n=1 Tax=Caenorhabditis remanei TaxID=31234 RepID=A0A6A5GV48_CAERE|nr:hypothetical protein GCK72_015497 [Caenorhabditis remanei]KAF1759037.1 hypothetical protein GCK72_015497 [Caenorhabditis remanei]